MDPKLSIFLKFGIPDGTLQAIDGINFPNSAEIN